MAILLRQYIFYMTQNVTVYTYVPSSATYVKSGCNDKNNCILKQNKENIKSTLITLFIIESFNFVHITKYIIVYYAFISIDIK